LPARLASVAVVCLCAHGPAAAQDDPVEITNLTAHFFPGPYSALYVDPVNPKRLALGTMNGRVLWSEDGAQTVTETRPLIDRWYDPYVIRGGERSALSLRNYTDVPAPTDPITAPKQKGPAMPRKPHIVQPEQRSLLLFLDHLRNGRPGGRWQMWMGLQDPWTDVTSLAMPSGAGELALASSAGILVTDASRANWTRTLGGPAPMARQGDLFGSAVAIDPKNSKHVLAATDRGLMVSRDGGWNFYPHQETSMSEVFITKFLWSAENPDEIFAIAGDTVLESADSGKTFTAAYSAPQDIRDLAIAEGAGYIATANGIHILGASDTVGRALEGRDVIAVCPWRSGTALAATKEELLIVDPAGNTYSILRSSEMDKFVALAGNGSGAWLVSERSVMHIGAPVGRDVRYGYRAPRLKLTQKQMEQAVLDHFNIGPPTETRLYDRWYAKIIPHVTVEVSGGYDYYQNLYRDATFPVRYRMTDAMNSTRTEWAVWANWDLTRFLLGNNNASNPFLVIENQIREKRKALLAEVRWHYREANAMAKQLKSPPGDPKTELLWRSRLDELCSYLEFLSGRKILENNDTESLL
jgi:hypothetical protein